LRERGGFIGTEGAHKLVEICARLEKAHSLFAIRMC
jgi:hypothetical protein